MNFKYLLFRGFQHPERRKTDGGEIQERFQRDSEADQHPPNLGREDEVWIRPFHRTQLCSGNQIWASTKID